MPPPTIQLLPPLRDAKSTASNQKPRFRVSQNYILSMLFSHPAKIKQSFQWFWGFFPICETKNWHINSSTAPKYHPHTHVILLQGEPSYCGAWVTACAAKVSILLVRASADWWEKSWCDVIIWYSKMRMLFSERFTRNLQWLYLKVQ